MAAQFNNKSNNMLFQLVETILCAHENKQIVLFTVNPLGLEK